MIMSREEENGKGAAGVNNSNYSFRGAHAGDGGDPVTSLDLLLSSRNIT